jgi:cytochrome c553
MILRAIAILLAAGIPALAPAQAPEPPSVVKSRCALCHGARGETTSDEFPRLAGQHEAYLAKEMGDFRAGRRESIMQRFVKSLSDDEIAAIARYYAAQPVPPPSGAPTELAAFGKYLYLKGNTYSGVPACKACHGDAAHGTAQLPRLAGQHVAYLERQVKEFTQRKRTNDNAVMHTIAEKLTALETRALAEYLASLP